MGTYKIEHIKLVLQGEKRQITDLICISTLRLWIKCPEKAKQSTGVSIALIHPAIK